LSLAFDRIEGGKPALQTGAPYPFNREGDLLLLGGTS
jgi:hypothetical protein